MANKRTIAAALLIVVFHAAQSTAEDNTSDRLPTFALVGGTLHPIASDPIEAGILVVRDGKIAAIGADVTVPDHAEEIDVSGRHVYPALIDADTAMGLVEVEAVRATIDTSETGLMNPNARALIAFNPDSELIPVARADGVFIVHTVPRGGVFSGMSSVLQLQGWNVQDMALSEDMGMHLRWPRAYTRRRWFTEESAKEQLDARRKRLKRIRDAFDNARNYRAARQDPSSDQQFDARLEALTRVTHGRIPLMVHADDLEQIQEAIAFCVREQLKMILVGGYDAGQCLPLIKRHEIPVIVTGTHKLPRHRHSAYDEPYTLPARLKAAGVEFCLAGFDRFSASGVRNLTQHAGTAAAFGLSPEDAVRSITLDAANILGVGERVGSLEVGKDATLIVTDQDVLEVASQIERGWIAGREADLDSRHKRLYRKYKKKYE